MLAPAATPTKKWVFLTAICWFLFPEQMGFRGPLI
jgi:hypothetical protein